MLSRFVKKTTSNIWNKKTYTTPKTTLQTFQKRNAYYLSKASIIGFVGNDPVVKHFSNGNTITFFNVAVTESFIRKATGEREQKTDWFKVVVTNEKTQEYVQNNITKGTRVYVDGQLGIKKWVDAVGLERTTVEIAIKNRGEIGIIYKPSTTQSNEEGATETTEELQEQE